MKRPNSININTKEETNDANKIKGKQYKEKETNNETHQGQKNMSNLSKKKTKTINNPEQNRHASKKKRRKQRVEITSKTTKKQDNKDKQNTRAT